MATCIDSIAAMPSYAGLTEIIPNTVTPFSVTPEQNRLFKLLCPNPQTVQFNVNTTSSPVGLTITAYSWNGTTAIPIGSVNITNPNGVAYIDFNTGNYIICVRPTGLTPQVGTIVGRFTGYSQEARFVFDFAEGNAMSAILSGPPTPPRECDEALFFQIVDGELPPGLTMDAFGVVKGWLPNLDCLPDRQSPSVNWYYEENDGTMWPWGREWRFQVKVWIDGMADAATDIEWFCVRVHNNWTYDQERFLAELPFDKVTEVRVIDPPPSLVTECAPCKQFEQEAMFVPQKIEERCLPCESGQQEAAVELIPIPLDLCQIPSNEYLAWFIANEDTVSSNPHIEKFKQDLLNSPAFNLLRMRAGYEPSVEVSQAELDRQFVITQSYQNFLQLSTITLQQGEGDEWRSTVRQWQVLENEALPTTMLNHTGEGMEVTLR